ncbi:MAG: helix-turn-helix domain-containing protein [Acetatifactor sp.]
MTLHFQTIRDAFPFIRQVIADAYKTDVTLYTYPYEDFDKIDRGFRRMMWGDIERPALFVDFLSRPYEYRLAVTKSSLGFYNIFAPVSLSEKQPDFISVGPFADGNISAAFIQQLVHDQNLTPVQSLMVKKFYEILPVSDVNDITLMVLHLLSAFIPEYHNVSPEYISYSEMTHKITPNHDAFRRFTSTSAEYYAKYLNEFLDTLITGDYAKTSDKLKIFLDANGTTKLASLHSLKRKIHELNTFCKEKLLTTSIHPYYPLYLSDSFASQIDSCSRYDQLSALPYKMARKYCMLIKNYSHQEYSFLVRSLISYIDQHIEEPLTLSVLAKHFQKNASFLSGQFSKETGESITDYIHRAKMQAAVQYFNTTDLSVTEVASILSIHNFGYFSKLFRREIGINPREYKKMVTK